MAKMAAGIADDLATTLLLATDKPVLAVPAMNVRMWQHAATIRNVARLRSDGVTVIEPDEGEMACGEYGPGRLPEADAILRAAEAVLGNGRLAGRHVIVTAGPTVEPIDPVRVIANRSSGKQGFAIAGALVAAGARVTLVSGPVALETPPGVTRVDVETAREMEAAVDAALPADVVVMAAAVADWRVAPSPSKLKKAAGPPTLDWQANPDLLAGLAASPQRPALLIGFAAETGDPVAPGREKLAAKGCDWILANDVSAGVFGTDENALHLISSDGVESWPKGSKADAARRLTERIADALS
jgi:phosphopantothenoylcysteine decarboxylase/phosphopantothenate--cysteine ligase